MSARTVASSPEFSQTPQVRDTVLCYRHHSSKFRGPQATPTSDQLATSLRIPSSHAVSIICLKKKKDSRNSSKHYSYDYNFMIAKDTNRNQLKGKTSRAKSGRVPNMILLPSSGMHHPPAHAEHLPTRDAHRALKSGRNREA